MTSAKSCKRPERTWLIETLRRCKALPVLIAVAYFLSNILPILLSYSKLERVITYVYSSMTGSNLLNILIGIAGGVVVSCAVFRYLHSNASVIDAHAKPLTRTQLFRGSFFAGLLMVIAPVVLTGLLYLCVMGAHGTVDLTTTMENLGMGDWSKQINAEHILCVSNIIGWILDNIVVIGFTYCVSCFAAILAGTAAIQALLSLLLISVASIVYSFFLGYMDTFLYGYTGSNTSLLTYLSPYGFLMMRDAFPFESVPVTLIVYAVISALIAFAAAAVYRKIRLENEEQTIVVPFVADLLVILLTALAVSTVLFIAQSFLAIDTVAGSIITANAANTVRDAVGNAENTVENAAKDVSNTSKDVTGDIENGAAKTTDNVTNNTISRETTNNTTVTGTTNNTGNYTATRTATTNNQALFGMNSTTWIWLIMAIVAVAIIGLVYYYSAAVTNKRHYNNDDE